MLNDTDVLATIGVKNLPAAAEFYEKKIGLKKVDEVPNQVLVYQSGTSKMIVYQSQYAGTNKATAATWVVDDVDGTVRELQGKGVTFEHYDFPGVKLEGDVHVMGGRRSAWYKDPDGNILSLASK
jgi:catechol 2,3-dioxygenase-like lactoylglutathione lyase family enzyme